MALPTITPSQCPFKFFTCSELEIPKPTALGMFEYIFISSKKSCNFSEKALLSPVTPTEDTQ